MNFGKLFDAIKGPLLSAASTLIPGGPLILAAVNTLLPDNQKLPITATGADIRAAVNQLSPDQRGLLMELEIAEINAWEGIQASLSQADQSGASTRPYIAKLMAWCVVVAISLFMAVWAAAVLTSDVATLQVLSDSWPMILALVATPTALLRAYFGMRTKEKTSRYSAATGQPVGGIANLIGAFKNG